MFISETFTAWLLETIEAWNTHYNEQQNNQEFDLYDSFETYVTSKAEELPCSAATTLSDKIGCYISNDESETTNLVYAIQLFMAGSGNTLGFTIDDIEITLWSELELNDNEWVYSEMLNYAVVYEEDMLHYSIVTAPGTNDTTVVSLVIHKEKTLDTSSNSEIINRTEYNRFIELGIKAA
ncbi:hypothetical protein AB6D11_02665 [Vibrio splendidus]